MLPEVAAYLAEVRSLLHLDRATERVVVAELSSYFDEKIADLREDGHSEREAARIAIESCGRPRVIARRMYEAHSKGSLIEAALASLPHLIVATLFVWNVWPEMWPALPVFLAVPGVTLWAWWHGKPSWLYPWIGISFCPLVIGGYAAKGTMREGIDFLLYGGATPDLAVLIPVAAFFVASVALISAVTLRVARRDWILASLMLVPLPIVAGWFVSIDRMGGVSRATGAALHGLDATMGLALVALAITSAAFVLVRQRVLKAGAVAAVGTLAAVTVAHNVWGEKGFFGLLALALLLVFFILSPALLEEVDEEDAQRVASLLTASLSAGEDT